MLGFNGGLIGKQRKPLSTAATGLWFLNEQVNEQREKSWPYTGGSRYWRFSGFANTALNTNTFDLTEIEFYYGNVKLTGITASASFSWSAGTSSVIVDGAKSADNRAYRSSWTSSQPTATLTFDFGLPVQFDELEIVSLFAQPRFPASFSLEFSNDGSSYSTYGTVTVGTSFTSIATNVFTSGRVAV
jgi:hypothetical protein